ncbi:cytochrome c oxidase, subunit VIa [Conidiobolus coronatus NRRL 28638]|uniref:Cytochrome c oxidase subunit 13, mitochondrial n=1 Tax=Conidiobolus coronatus (strain ATCC 28846 / CBS 209.66 / NRRL 28638) TaxID=796925 RepID=A0A137P5E3_CONC2|nr:cytochrome c oxidase, subunit VIa [Conidiobolus coronatus NRRL 28638]|eukprot:KXN70228.1 cytochrome c oxidase, subunit VIa [Conidiobolus coronatus NRRL 28638]
MTILRATRGFVLNNTRRAYSSTVDASRKAYFEELNHSREHAAKATDLWRKISLYICVPILGLTTYNAYKLFTHHQEHLKEHPLEFKAWPHLRIRNKSFPWADSDHSLFHNPAINLDPPSEE